MKDFREQREITAAIFGWFPKQKETCYACVRLILQKVGADGFTGPRRETDVR